MSLQTPNRFLRPLNGRPVWVRKFDNIEQIEEALREFRNHCKQHWLVERLRLQICAGGSIPAACHRGCRMTIIQGTVPGMGGDTSLLRKEMNP